MKNCPRGAVVTLSENNKPVKQMQILSPEIYYSSACWIYTIDQANGDEGDDAYANGDTYDLDTNGIDND